MKDGRLQASDLMIGDWVDANGHKEIVEQIERHVLTTNDWAYDWKESVIKPIPLTKEILEKNGFTLEHYSGDVMTGYWWTRNDFVIHNSMNDAIGRNNFKYEYVHQLQHALRLCGIEKEIEL